VQGPSWVGWGATVVALGWSAFASSQSAGVSGLVYAARFAPLVIAGLPAGVVVDRFGRVRAIALANFSACVLCGAIIWLGAEPPILFVLLLSALLGLSDAVRFAASANLAFEVAGRLGPIRAIAAFNLLASLGQALGALLGGLLFEEFGPSAAATVAALAFASGGAALPLLDRDRQTSPRSTSFIEDLREGLEQMRQSPAVAVLVAIAVIVEVFAFAAIALDPVFAGHIFLAGPAALGMISATRSSGRILGAAALASWGASQQVLSSLAGMIALFGGALVAYALAPSLLFALPFLLLSGVAGAAVDTIGQSALQLNVPPGVRGRAAGLWVMSVGSGPIGMLAMGAVADAISSARGTQAVSGLLVALLGVVLLLHPPSALVRVRDSAVS
jgi:MFS family permease